MKTAMDYLPLLFWLILGLQILMSSSEAVRQRKQVEWWEKHSDDWKANCEQAQALATRWQSNFETMEKVANTYKEIAEAKP